MHLLKLHEANILQGETVVCLGTFDGVHLGHQQLLAETVRIAREKGLTPCVYTFDRPPASAFGNPDCVVLTDIEEKARLMGEMGIEYVVYSCFDKNVASNEAEDFFYDILVKQLRARHIVIGFHYHFGRKAKGDAILMEQLCRGTGLGLSVVRPVRLPSGELVSSTQIRANLKAGDRLSAERMLNRVLSQREEALLGGRENE